MTELTWDEIKTFQVRLDETAASMAMAVIHDESGTMRAQYEAVQAVKSAISAYKSARSKAMHAARKVGAK